MNPFKGLRESLKQAFSSIDEAFASMDKTFDDMDEAFKDAPAEGTEKETIVEEVRPDGTRVITRTILKRTTRIVSR